MVSLLAFWTWVTNAAIMPGPGASADARAAIMCTSAQGLAGAAVGVAPALKKDAVKKRTPKASRNIFCVAQEWE